MRMIVFKTMLGSLFRDAQTLFWSIAFPIGLLIGLGTYFDDPQYSQQLLAGVLTMSVLFGSLNITAFAVLQQRNRGVYKLLKATPFSIASFVSCLTGARTVVGLIVSLVTLLVGMIVFHVAFSVLSLLTLVLILILGTICFVSLGFVAANFAQNEGQVNMISNLTGMPMLFLSEAFYSLENAPVWVQVLSKCSPFTYFVQATEATVQGDLSSAFFFALILGGFTLFVLSLAVVSFRWDSESKRMIRLGSAN